MRYEPFDVEDMASYATNLIVYPFGEDVWSYIAYDRETKDCVVVDGKVTLALQELAISRGLKIKYVLTTHKHEEHSGGNKEWMEVKNPSFQVVASENEKMTPAHLYIKENQILEFGNIEIIPVGAIAHTQDHLVYILKNKKNPELHPLFFTGDFLMQGGCGIFLEGSPAEYVASIRNIASGLNDEEARMFPGHDKGKYNLTFAYKLLPKLLPVRQRKKTIKDLDNTYFTTWKEEIETNPFIMAVLKPDRCLDHSIIELPEDPVAIVETLIQVRDGRELEKIQDS